MMVFISDRKLRVSAYIDHHQVLKTFLLLIFTYNTHKLRVDVEVSSSLSFASNTTGDGTAQNVYMRR